MTSAMPGAKAREFASRTTGSLRPRFEASVRRHPGARFAERGGDFALTHLLGDLAAERDRIRAALQRGKIEPFVRGDEIDDAGTAARPVKPALEQHVLDRALRDRHCAVQIQCPVKHVCLPFYCRWPRSPPRAAPVPTVNTSPQPF